MLHGNNETLSFEDIKSHLLAKENFDLEVPSNDYGEGLNTSDKTHDKIINKYCTMTIKQKKNCKYCKKHGHYVFDCFKLN